MKKTLHRILIALILLLIFPIALITFYEYSKLNDNEKLINAVYKNQLETIVSSINSYTQDIAGNWASRLELSVKYKNSSDTAILNRLINENQAIRSVFMVGLHHNIQTIYQSNESVCSNDTIALVVKDQSGSIIQISTYFKSNYRKFLSHPVDENTSLIFFICEGAGNESVICFIEINNQKFLQNYISPKMQSIAQDNFVITLLNQSTGKLVLSTEKTIDENMRYDSEGEMWLIPQIKIKISLKNETITDLVRGRVKEGLILIGLIFIVIVVGIWFLYSNVKREIQLAQIKSEFISNVSHEIRTPLALISMYIETLEMGRVKNMEKVHEYYQIITKETHRLTGIVNKILSFSGMENGKRQFKISRCNLNTITANVLETYDFHLSNKGFDFRFQPAKNLPENSCDTDAVADAIINLIDNAVKYSKDKKQIEISTGIEKNYTYIEVKDSGVGISKKHQKLIFDKFYRVTSENLANTAKGTGLGLAIVHEIVRAHKGKITLQSKPDEGSSFRLYFPIIQDTLNRNK